MTQGDEARLSRPERPVLSVDEDRLERLPFVERLTHALVQRETGQATGVTVGITGPWGSGKSSILNILQEHITSTYENAVVVRFDPWLVSGRDDLVSQFFVELASTIRATDALKDRSRELITSLATYGKRLAPLSSLIVPGSGHALESVMDVVEQRLSSGDTLQGQRDHLLEQLDSISTPIVILIDELDRVEDIEVRVVAQLVRSIADFPNISYVLAYDHERVVQALGGGERGRQYLEKIVQLQFPLPFTLNEELMRLMEAEIRGLANPVGLPEGWRDIERFQKLLGILIPEVISTPRDIKRLVGTFRVLAEMVRKEVDWIDTLAYSALLIKAPEVDRRIQEVPDAVVGDPRDIGWSASRSANENISADQRIDGTFPELKVEEADNLNLGLRNLLGFLFPVLSEYRSHEDREPERVCFWRPLVTLLRRGLLPGRFSMPDVEEVMRLPGPEIVERLHRLFEEGDIPDFFERLWEVYPKIEEIDHLVFWVNVGRFLKKTDQGWMRSYSPMHAWTKDFTRLFDKLIRDTDISGETAVTIFQALQQDGEEEMTDMLLRSHMFKYGLFGCEQRGDEGAFLSEDEAKRIIKEVSKTRRKKHIEGRLLPSRWGIQPVFNMIDTGYWDEECISALRGALAAPEAVDGLSLMMFGANYSTGKESVEKIIGLEFFSSKVQQRLDTGADIHETTRVALEKALDPGFL